MLKYQDVAPITLRDVVEAKLMEQFSGCLQKLDENCMQYIEQSELDQSGCLGWTFYASGENRLSVSTHYPEGLFYRDQNGMFGVGVFFCSEKWEPVIHVIAPRGANWQRAVDGFSCKVWEHLPEAQIYIRHTFLTRYEKYKPRLKLKMDN